MTLWCRPSGEYRKLIRHAVMMQAALRGWHARKRFVHWRTRCRRPLLIRLRQGLSLLGNEHAWATSGPPPPEGKGGRASAAHAAHAGGGGADAGGHPKEHTEDFGDSVHAYGGGPIGVSAIVTVLDYMQVVAGARRAPPRRRRRPAATQSPVPAALDDRRAAARCDCAPSRAGWVVDCLVSARAVSRLVSARAVSRLVSARARRLRRPRGERAAPRSKARPMSSLIRLSVVLVAVAVHGGTAAILIQTKQLYRFNLPARPIVAANRHKHFDEYNGRLRARAIREVLTCVCHVVRLAPARGAHARSCPPRGRGNREEAERRCPLDRHATSPSERPTSPSSARGRDDDDDDYADDADDDRRRRRRRARRVSRPTARRSRRSRAPSRRRARTRAR